MQLIAAALAALLSLAVEPESVCLPDHLATQTSYEAAVRDAVSPESLRRWHERLAAEPHRAGTDGDARVIAAIAQHFASLGLEVETHTFDAYLPAPISAHLEIVSPVRRSLPINEQPLHADPYSSRDGLTFGWNAYSGAGDVTAPVVYVNRGTLEDFQTLQRLGVSCRGKIAVARYGGNFRGYKAKYAQDAGAIGLIIYTDPADSGYARGPMWPDGGWANPSAIQRGSILTLDYPGDPLTPGVPATPAAQRLDPRNVDFPRIPVQPVGWAAAQEILSRLDGEPVPDASWQGALPFPYRLTGANVAVRIAVSQSRSLVRTANVVGVLRGAEHPEQTVYVGAHHDAWEYGAHDPLSGTIAVLEAARVLATLAREGHPPARSIAFAAWGAEEFGIIGSTEWVEANRDRLVRGAVAYFNLDAAASGLHLASAASPSLKTLIASVASTITSPANPNVSALADWAARTNAAPGDLPDFGNLGGGSDHVGFYAHAGVPSAGIGAHGAQGVAYHSIYDNLAWYQSTVGDDYEAAALVTRTTALAAARLANASLLPIDLTTYAQDTLRHADAIAERAAELAVPLNLAPLRDAANTFTASAQRTQTKLHRAVAAGAIDGPALDSVNALLLSFERLWLAPEGLTDRPWFRNLFAASDPTSGYAAWMLPEIRRAVEARDPAAARAAVARTADALRIMDDALKTLRAMTPTP